MTNPVLVEVTRGQIVESRHRGAICVTNGDGNIVLDIGDTAKPIFPRSAIKAIQALPLVESGAADAFSFGDIELSLASASHSGEDAHVESVRSMLSKAGLDESVLECGGHWSSRINVLIEQARAHSSVPGAAYNNCSGKHSGFVSTAAHLGIDLGGYVKPDHPVQQAVRDALGEVTGEPHTSALCGTDGCSIPTYAISLKAMARGFAKMATGIGLSQTRAAAARRILNACMSEPFYMAGTRRYCTEVMQMGGGRLFAKTGAEGVFCGAIPELGFGIALKCDDGTTRASEAMMSATFARLLADDDPLQAGLASTVQSSLRNWNRIHVGDVIARLPA